MTPQRQQHIRRKARKVLETLGMSSCLAPDIPTLLKRVKDHYPTFTHEPKLAREMGSDEAWLDAETETLFYREGVLEDAAAGKPRARFTLAHELGHYVLNHPGTLRRNANKAVYVNAELKGYEREADVFASYLLAPSEAVSHCSSPQDVDARFQISSQAAEIAYERAKRDHRLDNGIPRTLPPRVIDMIEKLGR